MRWKKVWSVVGRGLCKLNLFSNTVCWQCVQCGSSDDTQAKNGQVRSVNNCVEVKFVEKRCALLGDK